MVHRVTLHLLFFLVALPITLLLFGCSSGEITQQASPATPSHLTPCGEITVMQLPTAVKAFEGTKALKEMQCFVKAFSSCSSMSLKLKYFEHHETRNDTYWIAKDGGNCRVLKLSVTQLIPLAGTPTPPHQENDTCRQVVLQKNGLLISGCARQGDLLVLT
ncbi:MAG TPA: hypothetical protein VFA41_12585 [Ktedonobacteraceae bacterium]|jgi:hypothetical protein|nr:hypothetical protein [Ktedonobacteraceae bacterium]